ncbi:MAG TPA: dihydrofolate reductase family protein [Gemmatimonadaceae bacterium]
MRRVRYQVACSLDGYIAAPDGGYDWIVMDPDIDFAAMFAEYDTLLMGRTTYELMKKGGGDVRPGMQTIVFSRTLRPKDHPGVTIVSDRIKEKIDELRAMPGKDIWLFGGGQLFRSLLELGCVDTIEPAIIPVVLGKGIPMVPATDVRARLELTGHRLYEKTGTWVMEYAIKK